MKTIEIVVHCWAERFPNFADALTYQLSSPGLHLPRGYSATISVVYYQWDEQTKGVILAFQNSRSLRIRHFPMATRGELGRRSIGRNKAALATDADIVWFADADHVFEDGCLELLASYDWPADVTMVWPREIQISRDHATGDKQLARVGPCPRLMTVDPSEFVPKWYSRAIGGVQIVRGDFARAHGYLAGSPQWLEPAEVPFGDFGDDVAYRKFCGNMGRVKAIDLPGLFRLRHSTTTYQEDVK